MLSTGTNRHMLIHKDGHAILPLFTFVAGECTLSAPQQNLNKELICHQLHTPEFDESKVLQNTQKRFIVMNATLCVAMAQRYCHRPCFDT